MIALTEYDRLEASALWRPEGETQRREVIVSVGEATLIISDLKDRPLTHWSLPAVERINGTNEKMAIYSAGADTDERLEIEDTTMIEAITRVRRALERGGPRPGRLRATIIGGLGAAAVGLGVFWLPGALVRQAVSIVPGVTRAEIGEALLDRIQRLSGQPCNTVHGARALQTLKSRLLTAGAGDIVILQSGVAVSQHLPGGIVLLNRALVEDYDEPEIVSGYILAEQQRAMDLDPLEKLLNSAGLMTSVRLLTSGHIPDETLDVYTESLLTDELAPVDAQTLADRFVAAEVRSAPYAYAVDITGETTLPLIEADTINMASARAVLADGDWVALQGICGG